MYLHTNLGNTLHKSSFQRLLTDSLTIYYWRRAKYLCFLRFYMLIQRRPRHMQRLTNRLYGMLAAIIEGLCQRYLLGRQAAWSATELASGPCSFQSGVGALSDRLPLKFSQRTEYMEHQSSNSLRVGRSVGCSNNRTRAN
jgi:hypothetical protein